MSLVWVICGAGRGVGKTTLALKLCDVLPDSVYAKCGRSSRKAGKPGRFFRKAEDLQLFAEKSRNSCKHVIVESNTLAAQGYGDIRLFIDGVVGKTDFRSDIKQLRQACDLEVCSDSALTDWKKTLAVKIDSKQLRNAVRDCLAAQQRYLWGSGPKIKSKVWFESSGEHVFGNGLARLLENVQRTGTLQQASKAADMSYRYAWNLIRMAEDHFGRTLITRRAGGQGGGGSALSDEGQRMLHLFQKLDKEVAVFSDRRFHDLYYRDDKNE